MDTSNRPYLQLGGECPSGEPIAIIRGGRSDGEIIYLCQPDIDNANADSNKETITETRLRGFTPSEMLLIDRLIKEQLKAFPTQRARVLEKHADQLKLAMKRGGQFRDKTMNELYRIVKAEFQRKRDTEIDIPDGTLEVIPSIGSRQCCYAAAPSGSGKSFWTGNYAKQYNRLFSDNKVVLFSKVEDDPSLKGINNVISITCDEDLVDNPIDAEELKECLVIFDDTDTIRSKEVRQAINELKGDLLETGRHNNTHVVITSHLINNYKETRTVLNESHLITVYPSSGSSYQIKYLMKTYYGLQRDEIDKLLRLNSRWITLRKNYPQLCIHEHGCMLFGSCVE